MADNYLERRMEDYRSGKLGRTVRTVNSSHGVIGDGRGFVVEFPPMRILVISRALSLLALEVVKTARSVGCRVALLSDERKGGTAAAQTYGARFYPAMDAEKVVSDIERQWGGVDVIFSEEPVVSGARVVTLRDLGGDRVAMARFYLFVAHPDNSFFIVS